MNVYLSPDAMEFVEGLVASGQFKSAEEAVEAGVQLLKSQQHLRAEIQKGIDDADAGRVFDGEEVFAELREKARKLTESAE
jgi:antitoxin ParD1/3/4